MDARTLLHRHAPVSDARRPLNARAFLSLWGAAISAWIDDFAPSMGAALAYYTLFSLAPVLLIVIAVAGMVFGADAARGEIVSQLDGLIGQDGALAVQALLQNASQPARSVTASILGFATLLVGATSVFAELQSDLDRVWRAPAVAGRASVVALVRARILSFGMILAIGFLLLISLVVSAGLAAVGKWWGPMFSGWELLLQVANLALSLVIATVLFALIYKVLPRVRVAWRDVWVGAIVTSALFTAGKFGIGLYVGRAGIGSTFGAAGSLVLLMVWVYYSAQIFLLGAEFTWLFAHRHGSRAGTSGGVEPPPLRQPTETA
jgi:membrane protein